MQPIEIPLQGRLDLGDALQQAQALEKSLDKAEKSLSRMDRAAARLATRGVSGGGPTGAAPNGAPSSFGGHGGGTPKPTKIDGTSEFFDRIAKAVLQTRPSAIANHLLRGDLAGVGRTMTQQALAGTMRGLPGLLEGLPMAARVGGPIGAAAAVGTGGLLWLGAQQADLRRQMAVLSSATVGGPSLGSAGAIARQSVAFDIAKNMGFDTGTGQKMMQTLAQSGVSFGQISPNLKNAMMLAGPNQLDPQKVAELTGTLATSGGMNADQINKLYQQLPEAARASGESLDQLVSSIKAVAQAAPGAARDVAGFAAVQKLLGPSSGINAGALMSSSLGSTGTNAIAQMALLGMSPSQFSSAQAHPAQMWDAIGRFVQQTDKGPYGTLVSEQLLQNTGLMNMSGLSNTQQAKVVGLLAQGKTGQAEALAAQYQKQSPVQSFDTAIQQAAGKMQNLTGQVERVGQALDSFGSHMLTWVTNLFGGGHFTPHPPKVAAGFSVDQTKLHAALQSGMYVDSTHGSNHASGFLTQQAWRASGGNPQLFALMMAQMSQESGFNAGAIQQGVPESQRGYGIAQFTSTLGAANLRKYLGSSDPAAWHRAALNQNRAVQGLAAYDRDLLARTHGNMAQAASLYNTGSASPSPYGNAVGGVAQNIDVKLDVTVKHDSVTRQQVTVRKPSGHRDHKPSTHRPH
jgi:hypothetical protein